MEYILLLVIMVSLTIALFYTKDIMSPPTIMCMSYLIAIVCSFADSSLRNWDFELGGNTIGLVTITIFIFVGVFIFTDYLLKQKNDDYRVLQQAIEIPLIYYDRILFGFILVLQMFILGVYTYFFIKNVGFSFDLSSFNKMMNSFKMQFYYASKLERSYPFWLTNLVKVSRTFTHVSVLFFFQNYYSNARKRIKIIFWIPLILYTPLVIMSTGRWNLIILLISCMVMWYYSLVIYKGSTKSIRIGSYVKIMLIIFIICIIFTMTRTLVGRQSNLSFLEYVASHFGWSLQNLDMFLKNPPKESSVWGKETFVSLHRLLYQLGIDKEYYTIHLEFRTRNGLSTGNVYTGIRRYYYDFGLVGVIILTAILAVMFAVWYKRLWCSKYSQKNIIWYSLMLSLLCFHSFGEGFFETYVSYDYLMVYILILVLLYLLQKVKIVLRR